MVAFSRVAVAISKNVGWLRIVIGFIVSVYPTAKVRFPFPRRNSQAECPSPVVIKPNQSNEAEMRITSDAKMSEQ